MFETLGVVINASSILILYLLVYTLFFKYNEFELKVGVFNDYIQMNDSRLKNLVNDINHNDQVLRNIVSSQFSKDFFLKKVFEKNESGTQTQTQNGDKELPEDTPHHSFNHCDEDHFCYLGVLISKDMCTHGFILSFFYIIVQQFQRSMWNHTNIGSST